MAKKVEYKIISTNDFMKVKPSGEFDREETKKVLIELAEILESSGDYEVLFDVRQALPIIPLTLFDVYEFVEEIGRHRTKFCRKIAVLTREDHQVDNAQFFELCAKNRGFRAEAFTNFEAAIDWLSTTVDIERNNPSGELS